MLNNRIQLDILFLNMRHVNSRRLKSLVFYCLFVFLFCVSINAQTLDITGKPISLIQESAPKEITVELKGSETIDPDKIDWNGLKEFFEITPKGVNNNKASFNFVGKKALDTKNFTVKYTFAEDRILEDVLSAEVKAKITVENIKFFSGDAELTSTEGKIKIEDLVQNNTKTISLKVNGNIIDDNRVELKPPANVSATYSRGIISIKSSAVGANSIPVLIDGKTLQTIDIKTEETVEKIIVPTSKITIKQGEKLPLDKLSEYGVVVAGTSGANLLKTERIKSALNPTPTNNNITFQGNEIFAVNRGEAGLRISYKDENVYLTEIIYIEVIQKSGDITIQKSQTVLYPNRSITLNAIVTDLRGQKIDPANTTVKWEIIDERQFAPKNVGDIIILNPNDATDTVEVTSTNERIPNEKPVKIKATLYENGAPVKVGGQDLAFTTDVFVKKDPTIRDFAWLKINLDATDDVTVKDDWGKQLRDNYFVTKVELINVIEKEANEYWSDPILVYNQTLEVMVAFEYKDPDTGKWMPANEQDAKSIVPIGDATTKIIVPKRKHNVQRCEVQSQTNFILPYRPLDYDTALLTFESRENRSFRNKFLKGLQTITGLATFVSAIVAPGSETALPFALDQFNSLLIPSYEKLFPDKREVRRNNIIKQFMLPLEEVSYGSQITKYLLFPKQPIRGMVQAKNAAGDWKSVPIRITGISSSDACARVAVIKKD